MPAASPGRWRRVRPVSLPRQSSGDDATRDSTWCRPPGKRRCPVVEGRSYEAPVDAQISSSCAGCRTGRPWPDGRMRGAGSDVDAHSHIYAVLVRHQPRSGPGRPYRPRRPTNTGPGRLHAVVRGRGRRDDPRSWRRTDPAVQVQGSQAATGTAFCCAELLDGGRYRLLLQPGVYGWASRPPGSSARRGT